jgi:hypothetical protein
MRNWHKRRVPSAVSPVFNPHAGNDLRRIIAFRFRIPYSLYAHCASLAQLVEQVICKYFQALFEMPGFPIKYCHFSYLRISASCTIMQQNAA